jgi:uncharacterized protein YndB with AHSA1/START domain
VRPLPPQTLDFFERAPLRVTESATIAAPPLRVFSAFADAPSWPKWFPLMHTAKWVSKEIECVGAEREVALYGLGSYVERFLAWEPGKRFAFTMTASSSPLADAIAEDFKMSPVRDGAATRIAWTLAADPTRVGRALRFGLEATMRQVFLRSGKQLEKYLSAR